MRAPAPPPQGSCKIGFGEVQVLESLPRYRVSKVRFCCICLSLSRLFKHTSRGCVDMTRLTFTSLVAALPLAYGLAAPPGGDHTKQYYGRPTVKPEHAGHPGGGPDDGVSCGYAGGGPTAVVDAGTLIGTSTSLPAATASVNKFLGVPFAASPPERFSPPQPVEAHGTIDATQFSAACIQQFNYPEASRVFTTSIFNNPAPEESEDCL